MPSDNKLRIAIIGVGGIATVHMRALVKMDDEVKIVALADVNEQIMVTRADEFGIDHKHLYTDYTQMLEEVQPDAVSICTPNGLHAPCSIAASEAGAHVLVEKPMAMNAEEARQMIDAAHGANRKLVIGFQYRFDPKTEFIKRVADDDSFGHIHFARVQAMRRRGIPNWGVFGRKDLQGGGPLIDIGVHMLEQCHYVMGSPRPVGAVGKIATYLGNHASNQVRSRWEGWDYETYTVEDFAAGHIRFENGAVIHVEAMFAGHIKDDVMDFQLIGEKGGCTWSEPRIFTDQHGHMVNIEPSWFPHFTYVEQIEVKIRNFVDYILYDKATLAPAEHGLMVQQMLDGIYRSAEQGGKEVVIEELAPIPQS